MSPIILADSTNKALIVITLNKSYLEIPLVVALANIMRDIISIF